MGGPTCGNGVPTIGVARG